MIGLFSMGCTPSIPFLALSRNGDYKPISIGLGEDFKFAAIKYERTNIVENYYPNMTKYINEYNRIIRKITYSQDETSDDEDEFLTNLCIHLAHALIKDHGAG